MSGDRAVATKSGQIGSYTIVSVLGAGGMGMVYKAEQKTPIHRFVALKVVKPGFNTKEIIARFQSERQSLALMDHPNIAKVLEAGATAKARRISRWSMYPASRSRNSATSTAEQPPASRALPAGLSGDRSTRIRKGHPPGYQGFECAGVAAGREAGGESHRLRRRQGGGSVLLRIGRFTQWRAAWWGHLST